MLHTMLVHFDFEAMVVSVMQMNDEKLLIYVLIRKR